MTAVNGHSADSAPNEPAARLKDYMTSTESPGYGNGYLAGSDSAPSASKEWHGGPTGFAPKPAWWDSADSAPKGATP